MKKKLKNQIFKHPLKLVYILVYISNSKAQESFPFNFFMLKP